MTAPGSGLVPVHVSRPQPEANSEPLSRLRRPAALDEPGIKWQKHGLAPRWLGTETSDCAAVLEPNIFFSHGADELQRFLSGAAGRSETALLVATVGKADDDRPRSVLSRGDASLILPDLCGSISGRRLPAGSRPTLAPDLEPADRDLGRRLLARPSDAPWWSISLTGLTLASGAGGQRTERAPEGELRPILIDGLGAPVVAVWIPPTADQRWYFVPDMIDWNNALDWIIGHALPAHVPDALRRARSPHFVDPDLQTPAELATRQALTDLESTYADEKARLLEELHVAQTTAEPIRYGLLYGTGAQLVDAVDAVLTAAAFTTVNLDDELGDTKSADLLVSFARHRLLVEVKSAAGNAAESLLGNLQNHLRTWPQLRPGEPVDGGVLIINHQHRLDPALRSPQVYSRPEFVDSLTTPVISTRALFDWWRVADWPVIREAVLGFVAPPTRLDPPHDLPRLAPSAPEAETRPRSRWWRRNGE